MNDLPVSTTISIRTYGFQIYYKGPKTDYITIDVRSVDLQSALKMFKTKFNQLKISNVRSKYA